MKMMMARVFFWGGGIQSDVDLETGDLTVLVPFLVLRQRLDNGRLRSPTAICLLFFFRHSPHFIAQCQMYRIYSLKCRKFSKMI